MNNFGFINTFESVSRLLLAYELFVDLIANRISTWSSRACTPIWLIATQTARFHMVTYLHDPALKTSIPEKLLAVTRLQEVGIIKLWIRDARIVSKLRRVAWERHVGALRACWACVIHPDLVQRGHGINERVPYGFGGAETSGVQRKVPQRTALELSGICQRTRAPGRPIMRLEVAEDIASPSTVLFNHLSTSLRPFITFSGCL